MKYSIDESYAPTIKSWIEEGWTPALHGFNHILKHSKGGINPVNYRSEFVGLSLEEQVEKIKNCYSILCNNQIYPKVFVAPAHTFDKLTLTAIKESTDINVISDTIANDIYYSNGLYFIPQQCGHVTNIKFRMVTFYYHPNIITDDDFEKLDSFLSENKSKFVSFSEIQLKKRKIIFLIIYFP